MALVETFESGRFGSLMKGLKDITAAWNIDISAELEAYQLELQACLDSGNVAGMAVNFAEAAMLVQGCANVYSKKVDSLHQLAFDTLTSLGKDSSTVTDLPKKTSKRLGVFLEEDEFRPLGRGIVTQGCNDLHDEVFDTKTGSVRIPLFLIPREGTDRNRHSHRVSACELDSKGMLIFPEIFGGMSHAVGAQPQRANADDIVTSPFLLRAPPSLSQRADVEIEEIYEPPEMIIDMNVNFDEPVVHAAIPSAGVIRNGGSPPRPSPRLSVLSSSSSDEDPHGRVGGLKKIRVAPCQIIPIVRRELGLSGIYSLFPAVSVTHKKIMVSIPAFGGTSNSKRSAAEVAARRSRVASVRAEEKHIADSFHDGRMSQRFSVVGDIPTSEDEITNNRASVGGIVAANNQVMDEYQEILEAQTRDYDAMIRARLEEALEGSGAGIAEHFPQIYNTVKKWQDNLEPLLEEQNARPSFDLNNYTSLILEKLRGSEEASTSFDDLVTGQPQWNVSRLFLSGLILTNNGNISIFEDGDTSHETFHLRVIDADKSLSYAVEANALPEINPAALEAPLAVDLFRDQSKKKRNRLASNESNSDSSPDSEFTVDVGRKRSSNRRKTPLSKTK